MSCPACGCKVHYEYDDEDHGGADLERCAACGEIFDDQDAFDDDEDERT